ncbi:hypothetical protein [Azospirillum endophyticum]
MEPPETAGSSGGAEGATAPGNSQAKGPQGDKATLESSLGAQSPRLTEGVNRVPGSTGRR